jgi:hypothetical protein
MTRFPNGSHLPISSAHSTSETKIVGLPNFAPQLSRSVCATDRARQQAPHAQICTCRAATFFMVSSNGGQPTGTTAGAADLRISETASPSRKIWTECPASESASPWRKGNAAFVGSSEPQALFIITLSVLRADS